VREWKASGETAVKFSEMGGFSEVGLRNWSYRLKRAKAPPLLRPVRMLRVDRGPEAPADEHEAVGLSVEIDGTRIVVTPGFDRATLGAIIDVLCERPRRGR